MSLRRDEDCLVALLVPEEGKALPEEGGALGLFEAEGAEDLAKLGSDEEVAGGRAVLMIEGSSLVTRVIKRSATRRGANLRKIRIFAIFCCTGCLVGFIRPSPMLERCSRYSTYSSPLPSSERCARDNTRRIGRGQSGAS